MERPADINFVSSTAPAGLRFYVALAVQSTIARIVRYARLNVATMVPLPRAARDFPRTNIGYFR
jgi:hypothetical protein